MAGNIAGAFDHAPVTCPIPKAFLVRHTISDGRGREDQPNLRHGAALPTGGFAEFPRHKYIRKAETQQDTQDG
jgi:hypothetical protein